MPDFDKELAKQNGMSDAAIEAAVMSPIVATNVGYRYGLPAAGITLAGKALYDLTQDYQTSGTLRPE